MRWSIRMSIFSILVMLMLGASMALALQVGDKAPEFTLPATTANEVKLADYLGKKPLVLFFYIGAFTNT